MKQLLPLLFCLALSAGSCKKSSDTPKGGDISVLIIGKWKSPQTTCNSGYTFRADGTWSHGDFDACGNVCGAMPFGGTYQINGNTISSTGGPGQNDSINGRVEIGNGMMKVYDSSTGNLIISFNQVTGC